MPRQPKCAREKCKRKGNWAWQGFCCLFCYDDTHSHSSECDTKNPGK